MWYITLTHVSFFFYYLLFADWLIWKKLQASEGKSTYTGAYKKYASRKRFYGLSESQKFSSVNLSKLIEVRPSSICWLA
jgi:thiosulfate reductase cytochrome b subunit